MNGSFYSLVDERNRQRLIIGAIKMFGLEYTRVQVPVQLVDRQRYVDVTQENRPGVVIQQLKLMAKRSWWGRV